MATNATNLGGGQGSPNSLTTRQWVIIGVVIAVVLVALLFLVFSGGAKTKTLAIKSIKVTGSQYPAMVNRTIHAEFCERQVCADDAKPGAELIGEYIISNEEITKRRVAVLSYSGVHDGIKIDARAVVPRDGNETDAELIERAARLSVLSLEDPLAAQGIKFAYPPAPDPNAPAPAK